MTWPMWVLVGGPFAIAFSIMVGCAISEYRREAPVDTYRRLRAITPPTCPTCGRESDLLYKRWDRPEPVGYGCVDHGWIDGEWPAEWSNR